MISLPFPSRNVFVSSQLPLTLMTLEDWAIIYVTGQDSEKYLQGKVTINIEKMTAYQHMLAANCNPKGKMWSNFHIFRRNENFLFILRRSVRNIQINELKKYAIFSKVIFIPDDELILLGIAGYQSRVILKNIFKKLPDTQNTLVNDKITSLLWFKYPTERFLLVTNQVTAQYIIKTLQNKVQINNSQQWLALHIEGGIPIIDFPNIGCFTPQSTNLQELGGIDFNKGCYIGQEMVARAKFRGINKHSLQCLIGYANQTPKVGESIESKIGENWHRVGTILAAVKIEDGRFLIQAVMRNNMKLETIFRIQDDENIFNIKSLPYSL